jgi:DNA-binding transcriptional regulator LsrR (DeoR family)
MIISIQINNQTEKCWNVNGHVKKHYGLEMRLILVGTRAVTRHVLWTLVAMHVVAMVRLQHGVLENLLSTTHIL